MSTIAYYMICHYYCCVRRSYLRFIVILALFVLSWLYAVDVYLHLRCSFIRPMFDLAQSLVRLVFPADSSVGRPLRD